MVSNNSKKESRIRIREFTNIFILETCHSYSTGLSKDEEIAIEKQVCRNRQNFLEEQNLKSKDYAYMLSLVMFGISISQPLACYHHRLVVKLDRLKP